MLANIVGEQSDTTISMTTDGKVFRLTMEKAFKIFRVGELGGYVQLPYVKLEDFPL
jgi:hypothetical protein